MYSDAKNANILALDLLEYASSTQEDSLVVLAHNKIAGTYWMLGELVKSFSHIDTASQISLTLKNEGLIALNQVGMGNLYMSLYDFESAIELFHEANKYYSKIGEKHRQYITSHNIGRSYLKLNYFDSAKKFLDLTYKQYGEGMERYLPLTLHDMADIRFKMGLINESDSILAICLEQSRLLKDKRAMAWAMLLQARIHLERNDIENASGVANEAYSISEQIGSKVAMASSAEVLSKALKLNGKFEESLRYLELSNTYNDNLQRENLLDRMAMVRYNRTLEQLAVLEERNELIARESRVRMMVMIGLILVVASFIVFIVRLIKSKKQIRSQSKALNELNHFKNQMFSIVGHDLKAPLSNLSQVTDMFGKGELSPENFEEMMPMLKQKIDGLSLLINNLFDWAKTNSEGAIEKLEECNLSEITSEVIHTIHSTYSDKKVEISNQVEDDMIIYTDKRFITIVIRNILVNAVKYSYSGGAVDVKLSMEDQSVLLEIQDQGSGMSEKHLSRLFQLRTGSKDGTAGEKGSGLGLVLCKDLVNRLGGDIWATSKENVGSSFFIKIPRNLQSLTS